MKKQKENKLIWFLNNAEEFIIVIMFALMVAAIFLQVIMRYVFQSPLSWSEELGKFLFVWISWLGISLGARYGEHIKITMLVDRLPFKVAQVVNILSEIIVIGICAVTLYYGVSLVMTQMGTHYAGIKISVSWGYLAVVLGCGLMTIRSIAGLFQSIKYIVKGAPAEEAAPEEIEEGGEEA